MENFGKYNNKHTSNSNLSLEDYHYDIFEYVNTLFESLLSQNIENQQIVGHPEREKKILLAFLSTFWHPCSKCILMCFKKDRGGCQVWKCPKVPELGQRSTECKFL